MSSSSSAVALAARIELIRRLPLIGCLVPSCSLRTAVTVFPLLLPPSTSCSPLCGDNRGYVKPWNHEIMSPYLPQHVYNDMADRLIKPLRAKQPSLASLIVFLLVFLMCAAAIMLGRVLIDDVVVALSVSMAGFAGVIITGSTLTIIAYRRERMIQIQFAQVNNEFSHYHNLKICYHQPLNHTQKNSGALLTQTDFIAVMYKSIYYLITFQDNPFSNETIHKQLDEADAVIVVGLDENST